MSKPGTPQNDYERNTWPELEKLARDLPEAGVHFQETFVYRRSKDVGTSVGEWTSELVREDAWFKDLLPNFRRLSADELPPGTDGGSAFTSVCINTALYLPWLTSQCLRNGVKVRRGVATQISDAALMHHSRNRADIVVNCTGLSSLHLVGVEDQALYPARGQIVIVRNDPGIMATTSGTDDGPDEATYVMHRAAGGGCVLGGCLQKGSWESQPDPSLALRIMKRCVDLCPALVPSGKGVEALDIIRHGVGLRPMREGGIRLEREVVKCADGLDLTVVHNYGHGAYGYQTSFGAAQVVFRLVLAGSKW